MQYGIDKISFNVPYTYIDMVDLAKARDIDPDKYLIGIGQSEQAVAPITQDAVTLAANAALQILTDEDREAVDMVLFATESGIDQSKSAAVYVHHLTGIQENARSVEMKQACYSGTAAIQFAMGYIALHPGRKVLVLAADIARYGLKTSGEATQGAGAVAMVISENPRILAIEAEHLALTEDIMDFWRPNHSDYAYVDGKFSNQAYIHFFDKIWQQYKKQTQRDFDDFEALVFHTPYTKMGRKALTPQLEAYNDSATTDRLLAHYQNSIVYNKRVGNIYTGSLYLSLLSLLENDDSLKAGDRIGLFSYGSGAVGEFFSGQLVDGYQEALLKDMHENMLVKRVKLSIAEYETVFSETLPANASDKLVDSKQDTATVVLTGVQDGKRLYEYR